jgi:hypothetical protein
MNATEVRYADHLNVQKLAGDVVEFSYEPCKFRLADNTFYTPDFMVINNNMEIEFHEVKGSWKAPHQDDAKVKIKVAAEMFWQFTFLSAEVVPKNRGGGWKITTFGNKGI